MKVYGSWICLLSVALLAASCSKPAGQNTTSTAATQQAAAPPTTHSGGLPQAGPKLRQQDLGRLVDLIAAEDAEQPRANFDPAALAKAIGRDPQKLFEWVRDRTWWAPYRGLLRGAKGVMLDRIGSNLDRAVLLGDLMRRAGFDVRLAHAQLPENLARELLPKLAPIPEQRREPLAAHEMSAEHWRAVDAMIPGFSQAARLQLDDSRRLSADAISLIRTQFEQLRAVVRPAAIPGTPRDGGTIAALRDHWWVERLQDGRWLPMDALLPAGKPGEALVKADDTFAWPAQADSPSIPDADWHSVHLRVVIERYADGATGETTPLEITLRPAELLGRPITLAHLPKPWPDHVSNAKEDPNALGNAAVNVKEWVPFLRIGTELVTQSGFSDSGDLITNPFDPKRDIAKLEGGGMMGGFSAALGGGESSASSLTAEWLDYEVRLPGEAPQRMRRPVFDLLGPAKRLAREANFDASTNELLIIRYQALLGSIDILLQPCVFSADYVGDLTVHNIVANRAAIKELALERDPVKARNLVSAIRAHMTMPGPLPELALWRSTLAEPKPRWYVDQPNILTYAAARPMVNGDRLTLRESIDVVSNSAGVLRDTKGTPFDVRLAQGVTDTVAEVLTLGGNPRGGENAASLFAASGFGPDHSILIGSHDLQAVRKLGWPADETARLTDDLSAGYVAVTTAKPVMLNGRERLGWWRVNPVSGEALGVLDTGLHGEAEDIEMRQQINALENFLDTNAEAIQEARGLKVLTPGQSTLVRLADTAEATLRMFECMYLPFPC